MEFESLKHLHRYSKVIIASIAEYYETGKIQNPRENHSLMSLFALICEGKIDGYVTKEEPINPKWRLTEAAFDLDDLDGEHPDEH